MRRTTLCAALACAAALAATASPALAADNGGTPTTGGDTPGQFDPGQFTGGTPNSPDLVNNTPDDTTWMHGVVAADRSGAALAQIDLAIPAQRVLTAVLVLIEAL